MDEENTCHGRQCRSGGNEEVAYEALKVAMIREAEEWNVAEAVRMARVAADHKAKTEGAGCPVSDEA